MIETEGKPDGRRWRCRGCLAHGTVMPAEPRLAVLEAPARWDAFGVRQDDPGQQAFEAQVRADRAKIERERAA